MQPHAALKRVIATNIKEYLPPVLRVLFTLAKERKDGHRVTLAEGDLWLGDLLARHQDAAGPRRRRRRRPGGDPDERRHGTPKGVVGLHRHYTTTGRQLGTWLQAGTTPWDDVIMAALPLFHSFANIGIQSVALRNHNAMALVPNPRDLDDLLATIAKTRPTAFSGVPTLFNALLHHPKVRAGKVDLSSVKVCFSGAAPLLAETKRRFEELTGGRIVEGYSLTEAMLACAVNPVEGPNKIGSVGMPCRTSRCASSTRDRRRPADRRGGGDPDPGAAADGRLLGRPGGRHHRQVPRRRALAAHRRPRLPGRRRLPVHRRPHQGPHQDPRLPGVAEGDRGGAGHPPGGGRGRRGRRPRRGQGRGGQGLGGAGGGERAEAEELRAFCRERLAPYKVPAVVEFRSELPKSMVGKVLRRALTEPGSAP